MEWINDYPIGKWGAIKVHGKIFAGWRMSKNHWMRPFIENGKHNRFHPKNCQIPIWGLDVKFRECSTRILNGR